MTHQQIIETINKSHTAKFLLYEIQNLANQFNYPDGTDRMLTGTYNDRHHYMTDTIENLYSCLCDILKLPIEDAYDSDTQEFIINNIKTF